MPSRRKPKAPAKATQALPPKKPAPKFPKEEKRQPQKRLTDSRTEVWRERFQLDADFPATAIHGATPISAVLSGVLSGMQLEQHQILLTIRRHWEQSVGPDLARNLTPEHYKNGTLTLKASHPSFKMELQGSALLAEIRTTLQALPGCETLRTLRLTV